MDAPLEHHDLPVTALDYPLPEASIATRPAEPRDAARLMVLGREGGPIDHRLVRDLPDLLRAGDALVFNDTAVLPARLVGRRVDSGGRVQGLFLDEPSAGHWHVLLRSNGRLRPGIHIELLDPSDAPTGVALVLAAREGESWLVRVAASSDAVLTLGTTGRTPLPPYILRARGQEHVDDALDRRWYETVYADAARRRSVAAPTAGLHFTPGLLEQLDLVGVRRLHLTLDVGPGTFKPISATTVAGHEMHRERFEVEPPVLALLRARQESGAGDRAGRLIAVGTTTVRALESLPEPLPPGEAPCRGETDLLIAPPYAFRHVDGLLTNFHLPRSTLLALVGALVGLERLKAAYAEAVERGYRFYSYGDAMLILPRE